jgi:putative oxidoreductase
MERLLAPLAPWAYALMRIFVGLLFACHGAQKIFGVLGGAGGGGSAVAPFTVIWAAGVIELFGGLLIAVGLLAGWAAFVCSGQMAVAYFMAHASRGFWPIMNTGELAVLYAWVFLYVATRGSGKLSLESVFRGREPAESG